MLNKVKTLSGYKLTNHDEGEIGTVKEFYFDDQYWIVRYLVADTGNWLTGTQALLSPYALVAVIPEEHHITINLTKQQIESSPALSRETIQQAPAYIDESLDRDYETRLHRHYSRPGYWVDEVTAKEYAR